MLGRALQPVRAPCARPARVGLRVQHRGLPRVPRAASDDAGPARLTVEDAERLLDVKNTASFEEVLQAKNRKLAAADGDMQKVVAIEAAYDLLFMRSMKKRITGELEVSTSVRYADVPSSPKRTPAKAAASPARPSQKQSAPSISAPKMSAPKLPNGGLPVGFAVPSNQQQVAVQSGVFAGLGLWALAQTLLESPDAQLADTASLQMALALGFALWSMCEYKRMGLGKAAALTVGCLFAGALVGTGIESWLRVDIVPIGGFGSPGVFVSEVIIALTGLGAVFLV